MVEQTAARRATDRSQSNRHRSAETPQQTEAQRAADRCCSRRRRSCVHHFGQLSCRASAIVARRYKNLHKNHNSDIFHENGSMQ